MLNIGVIGALLSVLMYVIYNTLVKKLAATTGNYKAAMIVMTLSIVPMLAVAYILQASWSIGYITIITSILAGIFLFIGFELYYRSLHTEQLTNSVGLDNIGNIFTILFGILFLQEKVVPLGILGIVMILVGSYLIATKKGFNLNRKLIPAIFAGIAFSIFWILLSYTINSTNNFIVPLIISRAIGIVITIPYIHAFKRKSHLIKHKKILEIGLPILMIGFIAGIADGLGDTIFGFIVQHQYLAIGSALSILTTVFISILAYFVYRDRLTKLELAGLVLAILGAAVLILS
jgi:drug/metabolite transporter (DMT)-like permease